MKQKNILVISSVSGGGKNTVIKELLKKMPEKFVVAITATSRLPREKEIHGVHYYFLSREDFEEKIKNNEFLEYAIVHENYYGVPLSELQRVGDKILILNIDYQGMRTLKNKFPEQVLSIFLLPPDERTWFKRLSSRNTETYEQLEIRLRDGIKEIHSSEEYDYRVINDDLQSCVNEIIQILQNEKML